MYKELWYKQRNRWSISVFIDTKQCAVGVAFGTGYMTRTVNFLFLCFIVEIEVLK